MLGMVCNQSTTTKRTKNREIGAEYWGHCVNMLLIKGGQDKGGIGEASA